MTNGGLSLTTIQNYRISNLIRGDSRPPTNQIKMDNQTITPTEIIRRMKLIQKDADAILSHLMDDKPLDGLTSYGVNIHTHIDNITTACDFSDDESKTWKI